MKSPEDGALQRLPAAPTCRAWSIVPVAVAYDLVLEDHVLARQKREAAPARRSAASWPRWCATRWATAAARSSPSASRSRRRLRRRVAALGAGSGAPGAARIGRLYKVVPTALLAAAMRPSIPRARASRTASTAILDTLRATGANLAVHDRRRGAGRRRRAARDPRHHRRRRRPLPRPRSQRAALLRPQHPAPAARAGATH